MLNEIEETINFAGHEVKELARAREPCSPFWRGTAPSAPSCLLLCGQSLRKAPESTVNSCFGGQNKSREGRIEAVDRDNVETSKAVWKLDVP
jgi:hypothetical protein